jgi:hypothetical protein
MLSCLLSKLTSLINQGEFIPSAWVNRSYKQANRLAGERHQKKNKAIKLTDSVKNYNLVLAGLRLGYPPRGLLGVAGKIVKWVKSGLMMMVPNLCKGLISFKFILLQLKQFDA